MKGNAADDEELASYIIAHAVDNEDNFVTAVAVESSSTTTTQTQHTLVAANINEGGAREFLMSHGWPPGLQDHLVEDLVRFPYRFFICDNSGSMITNDGHKIIETGNGKRK